MGCKVTRQYGPHTLDGYITKPINKINLEEAKVIWYRRLLLPPNAGIFDSEEAPFVRHESRHFLEGLFLSLNIPWVNPMAAVHLAERKLYQLRLAQDVGLTIPETMVSNSFESLTTFLDRHRDVICKPVYSGLQMTDRQTYSVYTHLFDKEILNDDPATQSCPTLVQRQIIKEADVRVTFFGNDYFAVAITGADGSNPLDWRKPGLNVKYENITVGPQIIKGCLQMMESMGLVYGAFDFVRDMTGQLFFLEVNPAGEWAWLDLELNLNMRDRLISLFRTYPVAG